MTESVARNQEGQPIGFENLEFISIFDHWLLPSEDNLLDSVKPSEWKKFWALNELLFEKYQVFVSYSDSEILEEVTSKEFVKGKWHSDESEGAYPMIIKIPELNCVYEEHHDYTNLFWYSDGESLEVFLELVTSVGLFHFNQEEGFKNRNNAQSVV
tara:strand:+ start:55 stop:522 length:468 start_codon:yes stop_codon:yes gene_type:complete